MIKQVLGRAAKKAARRVLKEDSEKYFRARGAVIDLFKSLARSYQNKKTRAALKILLEVYAINNEELWDD